MPAQVEEADHHVGELDAGVVDVVLHLDRRGPGCAAARQHVAEHGVAQVADVRRLVGVDVGVLDDHLAAPSRTPAAAATRRGGAARAGAAAKAAAVEEEVQVAGALRP